MADPLFELSQRVGREPGAESASPFSASTAEVVVVEAVASRIVWVESIDVTIESDGLFSILDGESGDPVVGPVPGIAGAQYTYGPFALTAGAALVVVPPTGIVAGGTATTRIV